MTAPSNARLLAELQSVAIAVRLFGLFRLPEVMRAQEQPQQKDPTQ